MLQRYEHVGTRSWTNATAAGDRWRRVDPALRRSSDPLVADIRRLVAYAQHTSSLNRAETLAAHAGVSLRTRQRQFTEYVGIGPKWVVQRFRLLDAASAILDGDDIDWADLANTLGFSDQSHLIRVFTKIVGTSPAAYAHDPGTRSAGVSPL